jgi:CHAD domain-containing protein
MSERYAKRLEKLRSQAVPPCTASDPMTLVIRRLMQLQFIRLLSHEEACRSDKNIDALRTMRQIVYELRTLVSIMEDTYDQPTAKRAQKRLRQLSERLDDVHELDVMMRDILHYGAGLAQRMTIASIVAHLDAQRLLAKERLLDFLDSKKYAKFIKRFYRFLKKPAADVLIFAEDDIDPGEPHQVQHLLPVLLHHQLATVRAYGGFVEEADPEVFTAMRDDVRLFRYTLSCFEDLLGTSATAYLVDVKKLEDLLSNINASSETLRRLIHLPRINMDSDQLAALKSYRRDLRNRRERLYRELPDLWTTFNRRHTQENLTQSIMVLL